MDKIRFASIISDPEKYIEELFTLHPDLQHDKESGQIDIQTEIINSSFKYLHLEEGFFLFSFSSFSPVDIEYEFIPNPKAKYFTLVFYFTENKTKHPLYLKIDETFYSTDQISMFFNGEMNAEIFIKARHQAFGIRIDIHKNWLIQNVNSDFLKSKRILNEILEFKKKGFLHLESRKYEKTVQSIRKGMEQDKDSFQKLKLRALCYTLFQDYIEEIVSQQEQTLTKPSLDSGVLDFALNFLERTIYEDFPGSDYLADLCHMSESSFNKKFRLAFQMTAAQYFRNMKMKEALRLLQLGKSVKDVCYKVGYQDHSAFGRVFKQIYGKSPASYVK